GMGAYRSGRADAERGRRSGLPRPRSSRSRRASSSRHRSLDTRTRLGGRCDPGAALGRPNRREHLYLAWYQKAKCFHRVSDPTDIGYNCDPLARRNTLDPDVEIVPRGPRKSRIELVVEPNLVVPFKRALHCGHKDVTAVLLCDPPFHGDA